MAYGLYFYPAQTVPTTQDFVLAASQTLLAGDPVYLNAGLVTKAATGQAELVGISATVCTTSTAGDHVAVWLGDDKNTFYAYSKANDINRNVVGSTYDLDLTSGKFTVDTTAQVDNLFLVVGKHPGSSWSDASNPTLLEVKIVASQVEQ